MKITVNVDKMLWFMPFSSLYEADTQRPAVINITTFHSITQRPVHPDKTICCGCVEILLEGWWMGTQFKEHER